MDKTTSITTERQVTLDGMMTIGMLETGQHTLDFECCEDVVMEPFRGDFHVQCMRDGNVYMQQKRRRAKGKVLFREDNASLSQSQNGRYCFQFTLAEDQLEQLPEKLVSQASVIAQKVLTRLIYNR